MKQDFTKNYEMNSFSYFNFIVVQDQGFQIGKQSNMSYVSITKASRDKYIPMPIIRICLNLSGILTYFILHSVRTNFRIKLLPDDMTND